MRAFTSTRPVTHFFLICLVLCIVSFILPTQNLSAQIESKGFSIISNLDKAECLLGDHIFLRVVVEYPASFKPLSTVTPEMGEDIKVFSTNISKPSLVGDGRSSIRLDIRFAVFKTDEIVLPPFSLRFKGKNGNTVECNTAPLTIRIKSLVTDKDKDIKDIKGPVALDEGLALWILLIIATAIIVTALVVFFILRKRKKTEAEELLLSLDPPHIEAYKTLDNLSRENILAKGEYKKYYVILSDVIRKYLHRRFEIEALEQTTREISRQLEKLDLSREIRNQLKEFMGQCDLVKFAKYIPTGSQARESLETAYYIVDVTKEETIIASASSPAEEKHPAPVVPADEV
jgi:flagellar basal body-associated protein FliL